MKSGGIRVTKARRKRRMDSGQPYFLRPRHTYCLCVHSWQRWGLFSCQCPADTPAGLCLIVTNKHTKWPRTVCLCECVLITWWRHVCVCVCLSSEQLHNFQYEHHSQWLVPAESTSNYTKAPNKHTHIVQSINSIASQASNKLLILRWLTFCVWGSADGRFLHM